MRHTNIYIFIQSDAQPCWTPFCIFNICFLPALCTAVSSTSVSTSVSDYLSDQISSEMKISSFPKFCYCACAQVEIGVSRKSIGLCCENVYETLCLVLALSLSKAWYVLAGPIEQEGGFTPFFASGFQPMVKSQVDVENLLKLT